MVGQPVAMPKQVVEEFLWHCEQVTCNVTCTSCDITLKSHEVHEHIEKKHTTKSTTEMSPVSENNGLPV